MSYYIRERLIRFNCCPLLIIPHQYSLIELEPKGTVDEVLAIAIGVGH